MSSRLGEALRHILADAEGLGAPDALVGGLAVSVRTELRFTRDVDPVLAALELVGAIGLSGFHARLVWPCQPVESAKRCAEGLASVA